MVSLRSTEAAANEKMLELRFHYNSASMGNAVVFSTECARARVRAREIACVRARVCVQPIAPMKHQDNPYNPGRCLGGRSIVS